jgi:hypothetical protein
MSASSWQRSASRPQSISYAAISPSRLVTGCYCPLTASGLSSQPPPLRHMHRSLGPFRVAAVIDSLAYKLDLPASYRMQPVIHISHLKQYHDGEIPLD